MQFNTYLFTLLFLPVTVAGFFLAGRHSVRCAKLLLIGASLVFYSFAGPQCGAVLAVSILVNYVLSRALGRYRERGRVLLGLGILFNVGLLFYFKYFNFFLSNLNLISGGNLETRKIILPLGISFFTFQQISYLLCVRDREGASYSFLDYLTYILYFPKLVMGPLAEPDDFIPQLRKPELCRPDPENIGIGLRMFNLGLLKKLFLADIFAKAVNWGFGNLEACTAMDLWIVMICYSLQIYFDFSGYSDMAIGMSRMMNIQLPVNFDSPYQALSVGSFWKRWHMSLTRFFTRYIYIPLGGSRRSLPRVYLNVMIVFLVSGLWHGANWTFIVWGLLHGAFLVLDRILGKRWEKVPAALRWAVTFLIVSVLWLLFRSPSITVWAQMLGRMVQVDSLAVSGGLVKSFMLMELETVSSVLPAVQGLGRFMPAIYLAAGLGICVFGKNLQKREYPFKAGYLVLHAVIFALCVVSLGQDTSFVYFGF